MSHGIKELRSGYTHGQGRIRRSGGGSNASARRIVKQDLLDLANKLSMNILVMHYPPYCSKHNPIEYRAFSQIDRSWRGAPLLSIEDAVKRTAAITTESGLTVHVDVDSKTYEIKRSIDKNHDDLAGRSVSVSAITS